MIAEDFISRLEKVRRTGNGTWIACCPAHEDRSPSMTIRDSDTKILVHCFGGCAPSEVVASMGLQLRDLFADNKPGDRPARTKFPAADVLDALQQECLVIAVLASDLRKGKTLTEAEHERLFDAIGRVIAATEMTIGN